MRRLFLALVPALVLAGCSSNRVDITTLPPDFTYAFVVDGRVAKTISAPAIADHITVVVQPRNGESPIWQNYGATYVFLDLNARQRGTTPTGGSTIELRGELSYYRDLKSAHVNGMDEVVRGKPIEVEDMERQTVTVEPGKTVTAQLAESISVMITAIPKPATAPETAR